MHVFMHVGGTARERVRSAVIEIGPSVCHGGMTTLIGVSLCLVAESKAIFMFGAMAIMVVIFGLFHGLFVLPTALSLLGFRVNQKSKSCNLIFILVAGVAIFGTVRCAVCHSQYSYGSQE